MTRPENPIDPRPADPGTHNPAHERAASRMSTVEDAVAAAKAAVEEGIIPGGGSAIVQASKKLDALAESLTGDEALGVRVVRDSARAPLYWIAANAGLDGAVVVDKVAGGAEGSGFNAASLSYGDLVAEGIIDPVKVTRSALQNAASIAALFLTTEAVVADKPEKNAAPAMPGGDEMGGMGF